MILGRPWMKKYRVIIDITNNFLAFWPSYYTHIEATLPITLSSPSLPMKIAAVRIEETIIYQKIIKKSSNVKASQLVNY